MGSFSCPTPVAWLAYAALAYVITSILYLLLTRRVGTPFSDSLTDEQGAIKAAAAGVRRRIFLASLAVSVLLLALTRPLRHRQALH